jgi:hypothetical protein
MIGVDRTERRRRQNAAKSIIESGVAGRNMVTVDHRRGRRGGTPSRLSRRRQNGSQRRSDAAGVKEGPDGLVGSVGLVIVSRQRSRSMRDEWKIGGGRC